MWICQIVNLIKREHIQPRRKRGISFSHNKLGIIYFSEGAFHRALSEFSISLRIDPSNYHAMKDASLCYEKLDEEAQAKALLKREMEGEQRLMFALD